MALWGLLLQGKCHQMSHGGEVVLGEDSHDNCFRSFSFFSFQRQCYNLWQNITWKRESKLGKKITFYLNGDLKRLLNFIFTTKESISISIFVSIKCHFISSKQIKKWLKFTIYKCRNRDDLHYFTFNYWCKEFKLKNFVSKIFLNVCSNEEIGNCEIFYPRFNDNPLNANE